MQELAQRPDARFASALAEHLADGFAQLFGSRRGAWRTARAPLPHASTPAQELTLATVLGPLRAIYHKPGEDVCGEPGNAQGAVSFHHAQRPEGPLEWNDARRYARILSGNLDFVPGARFGGERPRVSGAELDRLRDWVSGWAEREPRQR